MINIENISLSYGKDSVLENISLNLKAKSFIGIIGKNGTGKSTLLKSIVGLLKPINGNIFIDDNDIYKMKRNIFQKVS